MTKYDSQLKRRRAGIVLSITGLLLNLLLFFLKYVGGQLSGSIAITADGFNNLADTGSCFLTLTGFLLGCKKPNRKYPMGYGRWEYLSGLLIAAVILVIGGRMLLSSVERILHPEPFDGSAAVVIILTISILIKGVMFLYNRRFGRLLQSTAMRAAALDSLSDCLATLAILTACAIEKLSGLRADGFTGVLVALCILYAGFTAFKESVEPMLGKGIDKSTEQALRRIVAEHPEATDVRHILLHDYGPGKKLLTFYLKSEAPARLIPTLQNEIREKLGTEALISPIPHGAYSQDNHPKKGFEEDSNKQQGKCPQ